MKKVRKTPCVSAGHLCFPDHIIQYKFTHKLEIVLKMVFYFMFHLN